MRDQIKSKKLTHKAATKKSALSGGVLRPPHLPLSLTVSISPTGQMSQYKFQIVPKQAGTMESRRENSKRSGMSFC
jgi:hypothetical protein